MIDNLFFMVSFLQTLTDIELVGILGILPMVLTICHEAGHYYAAKLYKIGSEEFSIGKGPTILRIVVPSTGCKFSLRLFPFGGRVIYNESYLLLGYEKRALISAAGWMADVVVGFMCFAMLYMNGTTGPIVTIIFAVILFRVVINISPIASDGRNMIRYLYLAATKK